MSGIQLGIGIRMIARGVAYMAEKGWASVDGPVMGCVASLVCVGLSHDPSSRIPIALVIVILGGLIAAANWIASGESAKYAEYSLGVSFRTPSREEWRRGILRAGLPQLPLTTLNSVISVCSLAARLFPDRVHESTFVTRKSVATSVGAMNVLGCFFGAMPSCHGAGGLSGQFKFGARSGASIFALGVVKLVLVLSLGGNNIMNAINAFPRSLLGALLALSGCELARNGAKVRGLIDLGDRQLLCAGRWRRDGHTGHSGCYRRALQYRSRRCSRTLGSIY